MAAALDQVQTKLTWAYLVAEWFHGIGSPAPDRAMATWRPGRPQLHARHGAGRRPGPAMSAPHSSWACPRVRDVIHRSLALAVLLLVPARLGSRFTAAMFDREQLITGIPLTRYERLAPHRPEHVISAPSVVAPERLCANPLHS